MRIVEILKKNYFLLVSTFFFIYIVFNFLDGERGLFSYFEKKIILLTENIDLDYLEILYREKFFYGKANEKVYLNR